jgi:KUP system potassium uptake protein
VTDNNSPYESVLVAFDSRGYTSEVIATATRLAARNRRGIHVLVTIPVAASQPIDTPMPDEEQLAESVIEQARVEAGRRVTGHWEKVRVGRGGHQIVNMAKALNAQAIVMPNAVSSTSEWSQAIETVMRERPCRVLIESAPESERVRERTRVAPKALTAVGASRSAADDHAVELDEEYEALLAAGATVTGTGGSGAALRPWEKVGTASTTPESVSGANPDVVLHASKAILAMGALGVVYGDLGTSPLYTEQTIFGFHAASHIGASSVYGITSLIFWSLTLVVSIKYAGVIMKVHNRGDGGIMALASLVRRYKLPRNLVLVTLGIFGASLFFGDGVITPAMSVLSAVAGLDVVSPSFNSLVVPISVLILVGLFVIQRKGTDSVGALFGPIMLFYFTIIGLMGLIEVIEHPDVIQALLPTWGIQFFADHGFEAFLTLGGVVLCVTGAEALYADRGHYGPLPIRLSWYGVVFPSVLLCYMGQSAAVMAHHANRKNPFFLMFPSWAYIPMTIVATVATVIASQAVISGSYSVARMAMRLGYLPRMKIVHTSDLEGQIYVPVINWSLAVGVLAVVFIFQSSTRLANAYGVAVTGTFVLNTILFLAVYKARWHPPKWRIWLMGTVFLAVEVSFLVANLAKLLHGAWLPLVAAAAVSTLMIVWNRGRAIVTANRATTEGPLSEFLTELEDGDFDVVRTPGVGIFLSPGRDTTPLALRAAIEHTNALHEKVLLVSILEASIPVVDDAKRYVIEQLGPKSLNMRHVRIRVGYQEVPNVPQALADARRKLLLERDLDLEHASYFVSRISIVPDKKSVLPAWQQKSFIGLARNAAGAIDHFGLPSDRTVSIGSEIAA